jgi:hypothetical protein
MTNRNCGEFDVRENLVVCKQHSYSKYGDRGGAGWHSAHGTITIFDQSNQVARLRNFQPVSTGTPDATDEIVFFTSRN